MKNILKHAVACLVLAAAVASCTKETTPERINIQHPDQQSPILRDNAYYPVSYTHLTLPTTNFV